MDLSQSPVEVQPEQSGDVLLGNIFVVAVVGVAAIVVLLSGIAESDEQGHLEPLDLVSHAAQLYVLRHVLLCSHWDVAQLLCVTCLHLLIIIAVKIRCFVLARFFLLCILLKGSVVLLVSFLDSGGHGAGVYLQSKDVVHVRVDVQEAA